ncbi:MAG: metalloprotease TldD [Rickettsiales bacterium]|nr:metalloprotease TldD [Rickettsiales bacterium]OUV78963.1 MAG: metalloprotease TldD [Rickettsiales bacterium TMED131]
MSNFDLFSSDKINSIVSDTLKGCDDGELFLEDNLSESFVFDDNVLKSTTYNKFKGFGLRGIKDDLTGYSHSSDLSIDSLKEASQTVSSIKSGYNGEKIIDPSKTNNKLYTDQNPIDVKGYAAKIKLLEEINNYARSYDNKVKQVSVNLSGSWQKINILKPSGIKLSDIRPLVRLNVSVTLEENGKKETGSVGFGGRYSYNDFFIEGNWKNEVKKAIDQATTMLKAIPAPAGEQTVVLGPGWPGILLHEAIGHGLEGDFNRKKISVFTELMNSYVANKEVTVYDDGTITDRRGSYTIDDEGTPSQKTTLIENGKLINYMQDRQNARLMNTEATGNGRRQSYAHQPMPRMSNTIMANGKHDPSEILKSTKKGIFAKTFGGGQVDITNGKFVFSASEAYMIEDGKITRPIKGATLIGSGFEVLKKVSMIGNNMELDPGIGTCGKNGQGVPVGVGQPTLKIEGLTVGGTETK